MPTPVNNNEKTPTRAHFVDINTRGHGHTAAVCLGFGMPRQASSSRRSAPTVEGLLCYNGTFTDKNYGNDPLKFKGLFGPSLRTSARTRCSLTILCPDNAMCFVRSWSVRSHYAWMVQRGCYQAAKDDPLPQSMTIPTRAMTCKHKRLADAEYEVCLCQANWCNGNPDVFHLNYLQMTTVFISSFIVKFI
ncbi:uncharacterized protein ACR2FA_001755 [Aphomia sociella]